MPATRHDTLREALDAAGANPLIQTRVDPLLLELQRRYAPLVRTIPYQAWDADTYNFNTRTRRGAGGAVRDGGARVVNNSTYERKAFAMAHYQTVGAVTGYAQAVTRDIIQDLKAKEIMGSQTSHLWDLETAILWGRAGATEGGPFPQFDGLDALVADYSGDGQNVVDINGNLTLTALDQLIDLVETNLSAKVWAEDYVFVMSPTAESKVAQLVTHQQRYTNLPTAEVATGLIVQTYRNIPIIPSSFLAARGRQMGTVTATESAGGTLEDGTYHYVVVPVMERFGELFGSEPVNATTSAAGSNSSVTLSFTPPAGPEGAQPLHYKVYRGAAADQTTLLGVIDAVSLNSSGDSVAITNIVDTGTRLETTTPNPVYAGWPDGYVGTNAGARPRGANQQPIYLIPRNRDFLLRPCVRDQVTLPLFPTTNSPDELPYAVQTDCTLAVRGPKYVGRADRVVVDLTAA